MAPKPDRDKQTIAALLRAQGPLSRGRIHALTGIRLSATSPLVREMLAGGRIQEAGTEPGARGRKGVILQLNENHRSVVGIEFDDETVTAGVTNLTPRIQQLFSEPARISGGRATLLRQLRQMTRRALAAAPAPAIGIGLADPGLVDSRRGVTLTSSTLPFWRDVPLREIFTREFGLPVTLESRTRAKAVAEHDTAATTSIYIDYGAGIGAGIYMDGRLVYGETGAAGEFGHVCVQPNGPRCACGARGCLEAVAGLRANKSAGRVAAWLGLGLANLVNLFNPGLIVIDARLALHGQKFLDQLAAALRRHALPETAAQVRIRFARLPAGAGVLGLAEMITGHYFSNPTESTP